METQKMHDVQVPQADWAVFVSLAGYYGYDGNGDRAYKLTGYVHRESYNAGEETTRVMLNDAVLYVNPYFIVTPKGYTKHYYNGSQRLAAVVGDINELPDGMVVANASERLDNDTSKAYMHSFVSEDTLLNVQMNCEENMLLPVLSKEKSNSNTYIMKGNTYYYHGDHLGSMSWITDGNGDIIEHRRYLPYGETWYEKRFNESDYTERYQFTGKERDQESGYDYFGARYLDAMILTSWLSVDPKWKDGTNPYGFCALNPLRNVDYDGMEEWDLNTESGKFSYKSDKGGSETDYYNVGSGSGKDFSAYANYEIPRGEGGSVNVFRYIETEESTVSAFHVPGAGEGDISSGYILELPGPVEVEGEKMKRTPAGQYGVYEHPVEGKHKGQPHLYLLSEGKGGSSDQRAILQHNGSYPRNSEGCQLTGSGLSPNMWDKDAKRHWKYGVTGTVPTRDALINYYKNNGWKSIVNIYNAFK